MKNYFSVSSLFSVALCFSVAGQIHAKQESFKGRRIHLKRNKALPETPNFAFGDLMQTLMYVYFLERMGAKEVVMNVPGYMRSFFEKRSNIKVRPDDGTEYEEVEVADLYEQYGCVKDFDKREKIFSVDRKEVERWKRYITEKTDGGKEMPVAILWSCAKNHNPERNLSPGLRNFVRELDGVRFFDVEYKTDKSFDGVVTPCKEYPEIENFDSLLHFYRAMEELGGKVVASESGGFHFAAQALRGTECDGCVIGMVPEKENERYSEEKYEGNSVEKCAWYRKQVELVRRKKYKHWFEFLGIKKNSWDKSLEFVRDLLARDARARKEKVVQQNSNEKTEKKAKKLSEVLGQ